MKPAKSQWMVVLFLLTGCVVTEVGNPQTEPDDERDVEIGFTGWGSDGAVSVMREAVALESGVTIAQAWLAFTDAEVRSAESDCETAEADRINQPLVVELISRREFPGPIQLQPGADVICRVELEAGAISTPPEGTPGELTAYSLLIRGTNASGVAFEVRTVVDEDFRVDGPLPAESERTPFLIVFDLNDWLESDELEADGDEELVVIDESTRPDVVDALRERIESSAELLRDEGGDGVEDET